MASVESDGAAGGAAKLVCFFLGGQEYAAPISEVKETMLLRPITRVFLTPPWLAGIINLRGDVVAVLDLARLLGQAPTAPSDDSRIVVARHEPSDRRARTAGVLVDRMAELRTLPLDTLQPPPSTLGAESAELLRGIATLSSGAALRVLDLPALFESERMRAFRRPS